MFFMAKNSKEDSISDKLATLGFSKIETELYLKLLEIGASTITELALKSKTARTTVHENVARLIDKGLITQTVKNTRKLLIAEHPHHLQTLVINKKAKLESDLEEISKLNTALPSFVNSILDAIPSVSNENNVVIKYFEGKDGFLDLHQRTLNTKGKELLFLSNMNEWKKVFKDDYAYTFYVPERIKRKIFAKTLALNSPLAREIKNNDKKYYREMRFLPSGFDFAPTLIISEEEVSIMTSAEPYTAIVIQQSQIAKMFKDVFNFLWEIAKQ